MSKRPSKYFFINIPLSAPPVSRARAHHVIPFLMLGLLCTIFAGCAPRTLPPPPPQIHEDLSLQEILSRAGSDISVLKAVADIRVEKNGELYDQVNVSAVMKSPEGVHMRMYKFGMLASDLILDSGRLHVLSGKSDAMTARFLREFFHTVYWWSGIDGSSLFTGEGIYIISSPDKEIRIDRATLLPLQQDIVFNEKLVHITYAAPRNYDGFWFPSAFDIHVGDLRLSVNVANILKNPPLGDRDFRVPGN